MIAYLFRRLLALIPLLLGITGLVFLLMSEQIKSPHLLQMKNQKWHDVLIRLVQNTCCQE